MTQQARGRLEGRHSLPYSDEADLSSAKGASSSMPKKPFNTHARARDWWPIAAGFAITGFYEGYWREQDIETVKI